MPPTEFHDLLDIACFPGYARGIIAIGTKAMGVIAIGVFMARGGLTIAHLVLAWCP